MSKEQPKPAPRPQDQGFKETTPPPPPITDYASI